MTGYHVPAGYFTQLRNTYNMQFAAMVVNVYDILITLDQEIDLVWFRPWKPATLLYLCNRYFVVIESVLNVVAWIDSFLSPRLCINLNLLTAIWAVPIVTTLIEAMLVIRVCTLFCYNRIVTISLWSLLFASTVVSVVFSAILTPHFGYLKSPAPPLYGCQYSNSAHAARLQTWIWIPSMVVEVILVILTVYKTCEHLRTTTSVRSSLKIVLRDGCLYFIVVLGLMIASAVNLRLDSDNGYSAAILQPELSISSVLCSRLFLNLRKSIYRLKDAQAQQWEGIEPTEEYESAEMRITDQPRSGTSGAQGVSTSWGSTTWSTDA